MQVPATTKITLSNFDNTNNYLKKEIFIMSLLKVLQTISKDSITRDAIFKYLHSDFDELESTMETNNLVTGSQRVDDIKEIAKDNALEGDIESATEQYDYANYLQEKLDAVGHEVLIDADDDTILTNAEVVNLMEAEVN